MQKDFSDDKLGLQFEESFLNDEMNRNDRYSVKSDGGETSLTEPFLHKYVDVLSELFIKAQRRIDDLNCMSVASGVADRFEITSFSSGKEAQFKNIQNLSLENVRSLLRSEMLKKEHCEKTIANLHERILNLEQRLAVTETAEKYYSDLKNSLEKELMQMLEDFSVMEKKRIEKTTYLIERNEKLERTNTSLITENKKLLCRAEEQLDIKNKLEKELHAAEHACKNYRNQIDSLKASLASQERENQDLSEKLTVCEREFQSKKEHERRLISQLKDMEDAQEQSTSKIGQLEKQLEKEAKIVKEKLTEKELECRRNLDFEIEKKRKEYERQLGRLESEHEANISKLLEEISRVKRERDGLVAKICDYEKNIDLYKKQVYADAHERLTRGCQLAVSEFTENVAPSAGVSSFGSRSVLDRPSDRIIFSKQFQRPFTSAIQSENLQERLTSQSSKSLKPGSIRSGVNEGKKSSTMTSANLGRRSVLRKV